MGTPRHRDISGQRFGRWLVLSRVGCNKHRQAVWACVCDCGAVGEVSTNSLAMGESMSCGCMRKDSTLTHGLSHLMEYRCWRAMMERCFNPANNRYDSYAERGISVCAEWRTYEGFLAGMGLMPEPGLTIERINNNGNYEPANCRWATIKEQARNRRSSLWIEYQDQRRTLAEWCEILGLNYKLTWKRLSYLGWSVQSAFSEAARRARAA